MIVTKSKQPKAVKKVVSTPMERLDISIALLERGVANKDDRLIRRFLRNNVLARKHLLNANLIQAYQFYVPEGTPNRDTVLASLSSLPTDSAEVGLFGDTGSNDDDGDVLMVDADAEKDTVAKGEGDTTGAEKKEEQKEPRTTVLPEVEISFHLLALSRVVRQVRSDLTANSDLLASCVTSAICLVDRLSSFSRHTLDIIGSKAYLLYSLVHELTSTTAFISIRPALFNAYRTACLRRDDMGRATLVNLLLRNYIRFNHYELAGKLLDSIPEQYPASVSNNQFVRHLYYVGRVYAVSCEYGEAHQRLNVALRKAPQRTARGFRIATQQLDCLVQLLIGEVPERSLFNNIDTREALEPYLELTQAVRLGELMAFTTAVEKHSARFTQDGNYSLVQRLRHSVIKTGLRNISLSYSRISFKDIATKLRLDTEQDAEYMCAKAIRDGVIEATLNHDEGYLASNTSGNVYSTTQPQEQFHQRIEFCLAVHNDAVKAMQYPPKEAVVLDDVAAKASKDKDDTKDSENNAEPDDDDAMEEDE